MKKRPVVYCVELFVPNGDKQRAAPHWRRLDCFGSRARAEELLNALLSDPEIKAQISEE
jgi:hypothetical protein